MGHTAAATAGEILDRGYAILTGQHELAALVDTIFASGFQFFQQSAGEKRKASTPDCVEGFVPFGTEFSEDPARPDLCETFVVWGGRNGARPDVTAWAGSHSLHRAMTRAFPAFTRTAHAIADEIRRAIDPEGDRLDLAASSYLQINSYRPADFERDLLQDPHEDGHFFTLLRPTAPGAQIKVDGTFVDQPIGPGEILLMPGCILTLMTGGRVQPLYHQVRNTRSTEMRQSLMFFCNPSIELEVEPWLRNDTNAGLNVRREIIRNSARFGLKPIDEALKVAEPI